MTLYGATDPQVIGQPISPFFGAQQNVRYTGAPVVPQPPVTNSGPQPPVIADIARGSVPLNQLVTSVNSISVGPAGIGGDPCSFGELLSGGNGVPAMRGSPVPPSGGINDQQFTSGTSVVATTANGPTPTNTEPQTLGPVSAAVITGNITLTAQGFQG